MHPFCERLSEPVCQCFRHDAVIVVVLALEFGTEFCHADAGCHGERADVIVHPGLFRRDEIGETQIRSSERLLCLLAQMMKRHGFLWDELRRE